jgi:hypothetical protein
MSGALVQAGTDKEHVFCVDCKYSVGNGFFSTWFLRWTKSDDLLCGKTVSSNSRVDLITGKIIKSASRANGCRQCRESSYNCGEKGIYWVPYNKNKMFIYLKRIGNEGETK